MKSTEEDHDKGSQVSLETPVLIFEASSIHGTGGFASRRIVAGEKIIEYVGERIGKRESARRCEGNNEYIFALSDEHDLDGNVAWNPARFINHSCAPNCEAELENGRVWIIANRNIEAGEEICFNYGFDLEDYTTYSCRCGTADCVGYIVAEEFFEHVRKQRDVAQAAREEEGQTLQT